MKVGKNKELLLKCECRGEVLSIEYDSDFTQYYIVVYKGFSLGYSFLRRIKLAWQVFIGREISTADVVLTKEQFEQIKNF